ncbi:MAG: hypothetical protein JKX72_01940 [Robiginitomaculum sp.]|nr:hypothetical protein [Robiginitomaculum sp.]
MKHHLMIAIGLILTIIFIIRAAAALAEPGLGIREIYVAGGFVFCGVILWRGVRDLREARQIAKDNEQ